MGGDTALITGYPPNLKESSIRYPPPAKAFVFIDEREDSLDDGYFAIQTSPRSWQNCPAFWHAIGFEDFSLGMELKAGAALK